MARRPALLSRDFLVALNGQLDLLDKHLRGLEARDEVFIDNHGGVFRDVTGYFTGTLLIDETAEPSHVSTVC